MIAPDPFRRGPWYSWGVLVVLAILIPFACTVSQAQTPQRSETVFPCQEFAAGVSAFAQIRGVGADLNRVLADVRRRAKGASPARIAVVEREIRRVWAEGLAPDEAGFAFFG